MDENKIIPYIEPIFRFCRKRLNSCRDAEDLSSEIICHVLDGMKKYEIESLDAWVWRVAHNRYARYIDSRNKSKELLTENGAVFDIASYDEYFVDEESTEREFENVFRCLHTLSSEYRNIFIDRYIGDLSIRTLSKKYSLSEAAVKWRLHTGREKIRKRIGEDLMNKIYKRMNWNTTCCNGSMVPDRYLHSQLSRAICRAAYEKPLTVEAISVVTGIPAMYIEDELPRLEYGDAVCKIGSKYAANFIIFGLAERRETEGISESLVKELADRFALLLKNGAAAVKKLDFYGHDFGLDRLGYLLIPCVLRRKIRDLQKNRLKLEDGPYPPRKDGGYGWFLVEETVDENENGAEYNAGCNIAGDERGEDFMYYYWISKYFNREIYHGAGGICRLCADGIPQSAVNGIAAKESLSDEDAAALIRNNLIVKSGSDYKLNFACFTEAQFTEFISFFEMEGAHLDDQIAEWIAAVRKSFGKFVPARLDSQINQWVSGYLFQIIGAVTDELIGRGILRKPSLDRPLTDGVFYVKGKIDP